METSNISPLKKITFPFSHPTVSSTVNANILLAPKRHDFSNFGLVLFALFARPRKLGQRKGKERAVLEAVGMAYLEDGLPGRTDTWLITMVIVVVGPLRIGQRGSPDPFMAELYGL